MDGLARAFLDAAHYGGGIERVYTVPETTPVNLGTGRNPFDGLTVTHWSDDR
jgi:hypothetical protein